MNADNDARMPRRTLLVHSDPELREAYREMLESCGHTVVVPADRRQAVELVAGSDAPDLAVLEAFSNGDDVLDLVGALRRARADLQVLVISTYGEDEALARRADRRELTVLQAPFTLETLQRTLRSVSPGRAEPGTAPPPPRRHLLRLALIALALLAAVVAVGLALRSAAPPPLPTEVPRSAVRGGALELVEPVDRVAAPPERFVWRSVPGTDTYRISIFAPDRTLLWQAETMSPEIPSPSRLVTLRAAVRYSWEVEALDASGAILARSIRQEFVIAVDGSNPRRHP